MSLVWIICFAPFLGQLLLPIVAPIYHLLGADPANFPGVILDHDGGTLLYVIPPRVDMVSFPARVFVQILD